MGNLGFHIKVIYAVLLIIMASLAYDLFKSKTACEDAIRDYNRAESRRYSADVIKQRKLEYKKACEILEIKAKTIDSVVN